MKYELEQVNPDEAYDYFMGTLSNRNRLKILNELLREDRNVTQLTNALKVDQSTISNNLKRLRDCGFVTMKPRGKERIYSINKETIEPLVKLVNKHVRNYCIHCIDQGGRTK